MDKSSAFHVMSAINQAVKRVYKLLIVVLPTGLNHAVSVEELARLTEFRRINVSLELSYKLLEISRSDRKRQVLTLLYSLVEQGDSTGIILERLELLFEKSLELNPLGCLKDLSRYRTVIAIWEGQFQCGRLLYAEFGHPEYRCYPPDEIRDIMIIG